MTLSGGTDGDEVSGCWGACVAGVVCAVLVAGCATGSTEVSVVGTLSVTGASGSWVSAGAVVISG